MGRPKTKYEFNLPEKWEDITLEKYQELLALYDETSNKPTINQLIACLSNKTLEEVNETPAIVIERVFEHLSFLKESVTNEVSNKINDYQINYLEDLKFGEFVDAQTLLKNDKHNYAMLLAILCRKEGEIYNDDFISKKIPKREKEYKAMSITRVYPTINFFLTLCQLSKNNLDTYSTLLQEKVNNYVEALMNSKKDGAGKRLFSKSQMKKLKTLKKQLNSI